MLAQMNLLGVTQQIAVASECFLAVEALGTALLQMHHPNVSIAIACLSKSF
jgi:hypothetical protein